MLLCGKSCTAKHSVNINSSLSPSPSLALSLCPPPLFLLYLFLLSSLSPLLPPSLFISQVSILSVGAPCPTPAAPFAARGLRGRLGGPVGSGAAGGPWTAGLTLQITAPLSGGNADSSQTRAQQKRRERGDQYRQVRINVVSLESHIFCLING